MLLSYVNHIKFLDLGKRKKNGKCEILNGICRINNKSGMIDKAYNISMTHRWQQIKIFMYGPLPIDFLTFSH